MTESHRWPRTVRLGLIGGLSGAFAMGVIAYLIPVPNSGGEPFFVVIARQIGFGSFAIVGGWAIHLCTGLLVGGVLGLLVWKVPRLWTGSLGRGVVLGLLAGITAWIVLFIPAVLYFMPGLSSRSALDGGLLTNVVFGVSFGTVMVIGQLSYFATADRVKCEACGGSFSDDWKLMEHAQDVHLGMDMQNCCLGCQQMFGSQSEFMEHMNLAHGRPPIAVITTFQGLSL